jgi:hypothetical protein
LFFLRTCASKIRAEFYRGEYLTLNRTSSVQYIWQKTDAERGTREGDRSIFLSIHIREGSVSRVVRVRLKGNGSGEGSRLAYEGPSPASFQWRGCILWNLRAIAMKQISEVEGEPFTSSINICSEACRRGVGGVTPPHTPPPYSPDDPWKCHIKTM